MNPGVEPWLRATHTELDALRRQVIHALELTQEDCQRWCGQLSPAELNDRPFGLPSISFQMLHIARSLDRLLTYAEDRALSETQREQLAAEGVQNESATLFAEFHEAITRSQRRIRAVDPGSYEETRYVGRDRLPTTLGGLLIHCAEHTQRHSGQLVTTAKLILALRS